VKKKRGRKRALMANEIKKLDRFFKKHPTATNRDGVIFMKHKIGSSSISNYLARLSYTRKRVEDVVVGYPNKSNLTEIVDYLKKIEKIPNQKRVYVDESFVYLNEARTYGRSPKGERILRPRDRHAKRFTVYLALGYKGLVHMPYISSQNATDENFLKYVRNVLSPKIRPGTVVIWDRLGRSGKSQNPSSQHYNPHAHDLLRRRKCQVLFLPPKGKFFNPIELAFSALKTKVRNMYSQSTAELHQRHRTRDEVVRDFERACQLISESDIQGWFRERGGARCFLKHFPDSLKSYKPL